MKKLVKDAFESIDQFYFLEVLFELVDSHGGNWNNFFLLSRESCTIFVIFAVVHSVKSLEKLGQLVTNVVETEDKDLEMRPDFVEV